MSTKTTLVRPTTTDDTGSGDNGTVFDAAFWSDLFDKIDALFGAGLTIGAGTGVGSAQPLELIGTDCGLALTSTNTAAGTEAYVAAFVKDANAALQKIGATAWQWTDNNVTNGYASWNTHSTYFGGGTTHDEYSLATWAQHGAAFFPSSLAAASAPGDLILKVNGQLQVTDAIGIAATKRLYLDGVACTGNTYLEETAADAVTLHVGTIDGLYMTTSVFQAAAVYGDTTANAANMTVAADGRIQRSTSTRASKQDIVPLTFDDAFPVVMGLQPVTFRGRGDTDSAHRIAGFIAEDVAPLAPMLATYDADGRPNYVTYDRVPAYLVPIAQDHEARLVALEAKR